MTLHPSGPPWPHRRVHLFPICEKVKKGGSKLLAPSTWVVCPPVVTSEVVHRASDPQYAYVVRWIVSSRTSVRCEHP
jgi:hypothetical protein